MMKISELRIQTGNTSKAEVTFEVKGFTLTGEVDSDLLPLSPAQELYMQDEVRDHAIYKLNQMLEIRAEEVRGEVLWSVEDE